VSTSFHLQRLLIGWIERWPHGGLAISKEIKEKFLFYLLGISEKEDKIMPKQE
jgi:hypothetical protein